MTNVIVLMGKIDLNKLIEMGDEFPEYCNATAEKIRKEISADFYRYAVSALDFVKNDNRIGGISLYNHLYNNADSGYWSRCKGKCSACYL